MKGRGLILGKTNVLFERGTGVSIRSGNYTKAACRAVEDALWHHSINVAEVFGTSKENMLIDVEIACQNPTELDLAQVRDIFPYGQVDVSAVAGGLDIVNPHYQNGQKTVIAHAAIKISLNLVKREAAV